MHGALFHRRFAAGRGLYLDFRQCSSNRAALIVSRAQNQTQCCPAAEGLVDGLRHRNRTESQARAHLQGSACQARHRRRTPRTLRAFQGQGFARVSRQPEAEAQCEARPGDGDDAHARGRGQDHHHGGAGRRAQSHRQESDDLPARAFARAGVRHEGRSGRRRLRPGRADGGHQPTNWASTCAASRGGG